MGVATVTAIAGIGMSAYQAAQGAKEKKEAKRALEQRKNQELKNVHEDEQVVTRGTDMRAEQQNVLQAQQMQALGGAGTRGIVGGLGRVEAGSQNVGREIGANLEGQQAMINQRINQDNANIRGMQEDRDNRDVAALSSQYNAGNQQMWQGLSGITQSTMAGASAIGGESAVNDDPSVIKAKAKRKADRINRRNTRRNNRNA